MPFLYRIPGVDNFDVIDFPGVDDQDDSIADLVNLLRTLSQMVVFVVNYRYVAAYENYTQVLLSRSLLIPHATLVQYCLIALGVHGPGMCPAVVVWCI